MAEETIALRNYAHLGDAVWEVFVREYVIQKTSDSKKLHKMTTDRVNASFQKEMFDLISPMLTEIEQDLARRGRNLSIPVGRRAIQAVYRPATAFEVLIGYWHLHNKDRLNYFYGIIRSTEYFT